MMKVPTAESYEHALGVLSPTALDQMPEKAKVKQQAHVDFEKRLDDEAEAEATKDMPAS